MCGSAELLDTRVEGGHPSLGCGHDEVAFLLLQTGALLNMVQKDIFCLCAKSQMLSQIYHSKKSDIREIEQPTMSEQVSIPTSPKIPEVMRLTQLTATFLRVAQPNCRRSGLHLNGGVGPIGVPDS